MKQLTFAQEHRYPDDEEGISISVNLEYGDQSYRVDAKVDPGAAVCLFSNEVGQKLGIPIERGILDWGSFFSRVIGKGKGQSKKRGQPPSIARLGQPA
jgi:hypothetical protein